MWTADAAAHASVGLGTRMTRRTAIILCLWTSVVARQHARAEETSVDTDFAAVNEIVFQNALHKNKISFSVVDRKEIERITKALVLVPKEPCECEHVETAIFKKAKSEIFVHFCSHCFDIRHGGRNHRYKMPKPFYGQYKRLLETHKKDNPTRRSR